MSRPGRAKRPDVSWYVCLRPDELDRRIAAAPVAYVPWGAIEWHSAHLPVGLDGILAEAVAARIAERTGGIVLPTFFLPIGALPHRYSITFRAATVQAVVEDLLAELARAGFRVVVLLTGHYAQGHELVLIEAAEHALAQHGLAVLATPPLAVLDQRMLDHAGRWETSALLATEPELVDMRQLERELRAHPAGRIAEIGILGESPLATASAAAGEIVLQQAVVAIARIVTSLLETGDAALLATYYERRRAAYRGYVERYFDGSWEEAARRWWADTIRSDHTGASVIDRT